jgi:hypothetical protein
MAFFSVSLIVTITFIVTVYTVLGCRIRRLLLLG